MLICLVSLPTHHVVAVCMGGRHIPLPKIHAMIRLVSSPLHPHIVCKSECNTDVPLVEIEKHMLRHVDLLSNLTHSRNIYHFSSGRVHGWLSHSFTKIRSSWVKLSSILYANLTNRQSQLTFNSSKSPN
jgi:hypothetical protein